MRVTQTFFSKFKKRCHFSFSRSLEFGTLELPEIYTLRERVVARTDGRTDILNIPDPVWGKHPSLGLRPHDVNSLRSLTDVSYNTFASKPQNPKTPKPPPIWFVKLS